VWIVLQEMGITHRVEILDAGRGDLKSAHFRALSPRGKVPVLVDHVNNTTLAESQAILVYLETASTFPAAILPSSPMLRAAALVRMRRTRARSLALFLTLLVLQMRMNESTYLAGVFREARRVLTSDTEKTDGAAVAGVAATLREELQRWEGYLASPSSPSAASLSSLERSSDQRNPWLVGFDLSAADAFLFPWLALLVRMGFRLDDGTLPHLAAYYHRLCDRPSIVKSWPPHWLTSPPQTLFAAL